MPTYHVSLNFAQLPDSDLDEFTGAVIAGLTGNAAFPAPAVSIADLTAAQTAFEDAVLGEFLFFVKKAAQLNSRRIRNP